MSEVPLLTNLIRINTIMRLKLYGIAGASKTLDSRFDSCQTHHFLLKGKQMKDFRL